MPLSRRYTPEWFPGESTNIGMDFSPLIPPGVGISAGSMAILTNTNPPASAEADFVVGAFSIHDRTVYQHIAGGVEGRDYMLQWQVIDTNGNIFNRAALMLCAPTS